MLYVGNKIPKQVAVGGAMLRLFSTVRALSGRLTGPQRRKPKAARLSPAPTCTTVGCFGAQHSFLASHPAVLHQHGSESNEVAACFM